MLVFSHLRWDFVYQRPQHLLSRMAARRRIVFIEEPRVEGIEKPHWIITSPHPGVSVWCAHLPAGWLPGERAAGEQVLLRELLEAESLAAGGSGSGAAGVTKRGRPHNPSLVPQPGRGDARPRQHDYIVWMYTPMAMPLARLLSPRAVVYDCMDELAAFAGAPPELPQREGELLAWADLVFTGGRSLYEAKRGRAPRVYCLPSSVDAAHFRRRPPRREPPDQRNIPHPRLGFCGVIDERLDLDIIAGLAARRPEWQLIFIGPVAKIDPASLPRAANLHYLGQHSYEELPGYLHGWDLCLLPFARNAATRYISPTKILEYMAAEVPIVSTPIRDVARPYGEIVYLAETADEFVAAAERALRAAPEERWQRLTGMRKVLARTSWDTTVAEMERLLDGVLHGTGLERFFTSMPQRGSLQLPADALGTP